MANTGLCSKFGLYIVYLTGCVEFSFIHGQNKCMALFPHGSITQVSTLSGTQNFFTGLDIQPTLFTRAKLFSTVSRVQIMPASNVPNVQALQRDTARKVGSVLTFSLQAPHPFSFAAPPASCWPSPPPPSPPPLGCRPPPELASLTRSDSSRRGVEATADEAPPC